METEFSWDGGLQIVRGKLAGPASGAIYHNRLTEFLTSGICPVNAPVLLYLNGMDFSSITPEQAGTLADMRVETAEMRQGSCTALLVRGEIEYLMATFLRERLAQSGPPVEVFYDEAEALAWIGSNRAVA